MKRILCLVMAFALLLTMLPAASAESGEKELRILFTHDIHSYFISTDGYYDGKVREHGGAARLKTLIDEYSTENSVYVDAGDFAMGTLLHAGYTSDAYELRILGELGCAVTTFGNHEFDFGGYGAAEMLNAAMDSGEKIPQLVQSNMITDGELTDEQQALSDAMERYGAKKYTVLDVNGIKIAVFGLLGIDGIACAPTSGMDFTDYIEAAKSTVEEIKKNENADLILCLSHSGTKGDGVNGEDFDLAKAVPDIDVIISGHTHSTYEKPVYCGDTVIVSAGEYLNFLGVLDVYVCDGDAVCTGYSLVPCDENVAEDEALAEKIAEYKQHIGDTYLSENIGYDDVICRSTFDFMPFREMEKAHQEYPIGNLIADSYIYEAEQNGIDDIDVVLVALGTIRGSIMKGDITTGDAFEICSLGMGGDGSAGHPLVCGYLSGHELKLIAELDASLGPIVSSIKMSYYGIRYTFNTKRMLLDRVTDICLVRRDGTEEKIEDDKLYKVCCNMYAVNMLGMLNGLTYRLLTITPKDENGTVVTDLYSLSMMNTEGKEVKEWAAFRDYLMSMPEEDGVPTIPQKYASSDNRKNKVSVGGFAVIAHPGLTTSVVIAVPAAIIVLIAVLCLTHKRRKARRQARKAARKAKKN